MRDIYYSLFNGVVSRFVVFAINSIAVKLLLDEQFGKFSYLMTIVASFAAVSVMGMGVAVNKSVATHFSKNPDFARRVVTSSIGLITLLILVGSMVLFPFLDVAHKFGVSSELLSYAILVMFVWLISVAGIVEGALNGLGAYKSMAVNSGIVFAVVMPITYLSISTAGIIGGILSLLIYRFLAVSLNFTTLIRRRAVSFGYPIASLLQKDTVDVFLKIGFPAMLGTVLVGPTIALAMTMLSGQKDGMRELAYFSWVYQIYLMAIFVPNMLAGFYLSKLARGDGRGYRLPKVIKINTGFSLLAAGALVFLKPFILGYAGEGYVTSANGVYNLMAAVIIMFGINSSFSSYWVANSKVWLGFFLNLIWAVALLTTVYILSETRGAEAIALGFLYAYCVQFCIQAALAVRLNKASVS